MASTPVPPTITDLLAEAARKSPEAAVLLAPGSSPLTYGRLLERRDDVVRRLNRIGVGRNDRVAVVLGNGPELAASFLTISSGATFAPLNPEYRESEFAFYLADLNARAVVVARGVETPALAVAERLGIIVIDLVRAEGGAAGEFTLEGPDGPMPARPGTACEDDVALILHTSGTTGRPKRVPLTHRNVTASAGHIRDTLGLTSRDLCLNVMPLFHIHGLIGAALASAAAGAGLVSTPGFDASRFFGWLEEFGATWYTAVPTVHQAVLAEAARRPGGVFGHRLRLIRSSSSALPPPVLHDLERTFGVPVLESYGMTEASHQMCSNPPPPGEHKSGSVGPAAGPEVAVMGELGQLLGPGETGEIVIRGPNVMRAYEGDSEANASAFSGGWFRTGDLGHRDTQGYYVITGRIKEMINRGGEKIAPREVDEAFLGHPDVAQAVAFAAPHPRLGEDLIAAVVLRPGGSATADQLRRFALDRLAAHKVPSQVVIVSEIPKGPTGKFRRVGLHELLKHRLRADHVAPEGPFEEAVAEAWHEVLDVPRVGAGDNFFALGGDSLLAARVVARLGTAFEVDLPLEVTFRSPTLSGQALEIEDLLLRTIEHLPEPD